MWGKIKKSTITAEIFPYSGIKVKVKSVVSDSLWPHGL